MRLQILDGSVAEALVRLRVQKACDQIGSNVGDGLRNLELTLCDGFVRFLDALAVERALTGEHLEEDAAESPEVSAVAVGLLLKHLGCEVVIGADQLVVTAG